MQYALLFYDPNPELGAALSPDDVQEFMAAAATKGVYGGERLEPATAATTVRRRDGQTLTTDGPFAETKEILGGFFLVEADNVDDVIALAAKIPTARTGSVEIRPIGARPQR